MKEIHIQKGRTRQEELNKLSKEDKVVYINCALSKPLVIEILSRAPHIEQIYLPKGAYRRTNKRILEALRKSGVICKIKDNTAGRPKKYTREMVNTVKKQYELGKSAKEISKTLHIPLRSVYKIIKEQN